MSNNNDDTWAIKLGLYLVIAAAIVAVVVAAISVVAGIGGLIGFGCSAKNFFKAITGNLGQRSFA